MNRNDYIVEKFRKGNLDVLYDELYKALLLYASRCLTERFAFLAEDCVQDAILRAYKSHGSFQSDSELRSYLYAAVHGKAVDIIRKSNSHERYVISTEQQTEEMLTDIVEHESMDRLFRAVKKLTASDRELFFDYRDGLKTSEIAAKLGITESAVKQRKAKMISKLQKELDDSALLAITLLTAFPYLPS